MPGWTGRVFLVTTSSDTNTAWLDLAGLMGIGDEDIAIRAATLLSDPSGHTAAETTDMLMNVAWDSAGLGSVLVHTFTQITSTNVDETLILPGGDSAAVLHNVLGTNAGILGGPVPQYWQFSWTLDAATARGLDVFASIAYEF